MNTIDEVLKTREQINSNFYGKSRQLLSSMLSELAQKISAIELDIKNVK